VDDVGNSFEKKLFFREGKLVLTWEAHGVITIFDNVTMSKPVLVFDEFNREIAKF